jgi:hypothetical protein
MRAQLETAYMTGDRNHLPGGAQAAYVIEAAERSARRLAWR